MTTWENRNVGDIFTLRDDGHDNKRAKTCLIVDRDLAAFFPGPFFTVNSDGSNVYYDGHVLYCPYLRRYANIIRPHNMEMSNTLQNLPPRNGCDRQLNKEVSE
jgi:hypothetical protein